jgi:predicted transcriptional regulator of viral defense system
VTVSQQKLEKLLAGGGPLRSRAFVHAGLTRSELSRMVASGRLIRLGRGLYAAPEYQPGENQALLAVAQRAPKVVFCLLTALRFHDLTTQAPFQVWIAIANKAHPPRLDYPPVRTVRYSVKSLAAGVEQHRVEGTTIRVTSIAKTVADCFKFRNKVGLDVALEALRDARRDKKVLPDEIWRYASVNRVANVMRPYLEAVA